MKVNPTTLAIEFPVPFIPQHALYRLPVIAFLVICLFPTLILKAQPAKPMSGFPSPNAANLGLYTQVPVSNFTGTPVIDIPLWEVKEGTVTVPVNLSYHPASVRVHSQPGWVGLGWSLQPGGAITRKMNGYVDEFLTKPHTALGAGQYGLGFYSSYAKLNGNDTEWYGNSRLQDYAEDAVPSLSAYYESMPDEFNFNFLGYSGQFFLTHDGQWKVISDQDIKLEFDTANGEGFIKEDQLRPELYDKIAPLSPWDDGEWTARYFNKFTLVTPDGVRYVFGGIYATEYSVQFKLMGIAHPIATTFYLSKIILPTGKSINFTYAVGPLLGNFTQGYFSSSASRSPSGLLGADCWPNSTLHATPVDGYLIMPVYLAHIDTERESLYFERGNANAQLRWPSDATIDNMMGTCGYPGPVNPIYFEPICPGFPAPPYTSYGAQLKTVQLNSLHISSMGTTFKYDFTYTSNTQERLKLLEVTKAESVLPQLLPKFPGHRFTYNPNTLPSYAELKSNDHWDFYNGFEPANFPAVTLPLETFAGLYYNAREPDVTGEAMKAEVLEQIQYPTGGVAKFTYEPHMYSKLVDRQTLLPAPNNLTFPVRNLYHNRVAGGLRIKSITHHESPQSTAPLLVKEFYYVKGYKPGDNPATLSSSGILAGLPKYYWPDYVGEDISGEEFTYTVFTSGSLLPHGYNAQGSHIGYSEVVEVTKNNADPTTNGFTRYQYTNFETDMWGNAHLDEVGISSDPTRSVYSPFSDHSRQRGKILSEEIYGANPLQPIKKTTYQYALVNNGFVRRILQDRFNVCSSTHAGAQTVYVTAYKAYAYRYNLISQQVTEYAGAAALTRTTTFEYTAQNFINRTTETNSEGTILEQQITYPLDYTTNSAIITGDWEAIGLSKLVSKNILNTPVEIIKKRNGKLTSATLTGYQVFGANVFAHKTWKTELTESLLTGGTIGNGVNTETDKFNPAGLYLNGTHVFRRDEHYTQQPEIFSKYDSYGNVLERYTDPNLPTSYLYSYKSVYPVAEIKGVAYDQLPASFGECTLSSIGTQLPPAVYLRNCINALRASIPQALIKSQTFGPTGISSQTDENGRTTYYEYDAVGRLKLVRDHEGKVRQGIKYTYRNQ